MYIENKGHCGENKPGGFNFQPTYSGHPYLCVIYSHGLDTGSLGVRGAAHAIYPVGLILMPKPDPGVPGTQLLLFLQSTTVSAALPGWS